MLFGTDRKENSFAVIAGSGREENRNNSYILKASFAQPSGITVTTGSEKHIYIADSESSTIRSINPKGQVVGIVGGSRDPTDLFAFGDVDGKGVAAKLQHPMGVCCGPNAAEIFIADTYNHKIKRINTDTKECLTVISSGLNEPSGICLDSNSNLLYVVDTNNHAIKLMNLIDGNLHTMEFMVPNVTLNNSLPGSVDKQFEIHTGGKSVPLLLNFCLSPLPDAYEGGQWKVVSEDSLPIPIKKGTLEVKEMKKGIFSINVLDPHKIMDFIVIVDVFFCDESSCLKRTRKLKISFKNGTNETLQKSEHLISWDQITWS
ncbi:NHL repeat-containing protein 2 [Orchesella cincta]|uniref:NHL repeat-containing protein 2 n=1 Tax=Orchesella cincta TaxID=48709 RepID=A0A1D2NEV5_ORCCI|nr:NHL repeat-containing protein 2 [Orchesella cincta]